MAKKKRKRKQLWVVVDERGEITRGRLGPSPRRNYRRGRNLQLGASDDTHLHQARMSLTRAVQAQRRALQAARGPAVSGRCAKVWEQLVTAAANESHAQAHLSSLHPNTTGKREWNSYFRISKANNQMRDTLGFQCTRRVGGIR